MAAVQFNIWHLSLGNYNTWYTMSDISLSVDHILMYILMLLPVK